MGCCKHGNTDGDCVQCLRDEIAELREVTTLAYRALEDAFSVLSTIEGDDANEQRELDLLAKRVKDVSVGLFTLLRHTGPNTPHEREAESRPPDMVAGPRPGLYLCSRSSEIGGGKPCDEAFKVVLVQTAIAQTEKWAVEVTDLQAFSDKHGACVIGRNSDGFCTIEIYDTYRE